MCLCLNLVMTDAPNHPVSQTPRSTRRTKVAQIYRTTGNLRAVQLLLGHAKIDYVGFRTITSSVFSFD